MRNATMRIDSRIADLRYRRGESMPGRSSIVGRAILPAAAFQAALSGNDRPSYPAGPAESRPQPGLAAPQSGQNCQAKWQRALGLLVLFAAPWLRAQTPGRE